MITIPPLYARPPPVAEQIRDGQIGIDRQETESNRRRSRFDGSEVAGIDREVDDFMHQFYHSATVTDARGGRSHSRVHNAVHQRRIDQ